MDWSTIGFVSYVLLWIVVLVQVVLTLALARLVGQLMSPRFPGSGARLIDPGPSIDSAMEDWAGNDLFGVARRISFPRERGLFLLYISPHCTLCSALLPAARRFFQEIAPEAEAVWVMVLGSSDAQAGYARENRLTDHLVLREEELPASWRLEGAPYGVWVNAEGRVKAKGMVNNREQLESLRLALRVGHPSVESYVSEQFGEASRSAEDAPQLGGVG